MMLIIQKLKIIFSPLLNLTQLILVLNVFKLYNFALVLFLKHKISLLLNLETDFSFVKLTCPQGTNALAVSLIPKYVKKIKNKKINK